MYPDTEVNKTSGQVICDLKILFIKPFRAVETYLTTVDQKSSITGNNGIKLIKTRVDLWKNHFFFGLFCFFNFLVVVKTQTLEKI